MMPTIVLKVADTAEAFEEGARLFQQYIDFLGLDLSFQGFAAELKTINQQYNKPTGALLLAYKDSRPIGCVGIRALATGTAELKRMFVQPDYQGHKIGQRLLEQILDLAKSLRYQYIRLDTLSYMENALKLYHAYGFYEIPPYRFNPIAGAIYMEKKLL
ncbi:MAG TPA: GNAT family N-acetyltransferase [Flavisolibacter sp.]|nr:GNAT family N-acetyltransferase [Flavisolibacter sp.]